MRDRSRHLRSSLLPAVAAVALAACATGGGSAPAAPDPIALQRGWKVYVYGTNDTVVGYTTLPQYPADTTKPNEILDSVAGAFCTPALDRTNPAPDDHLRDFCRHSEGAGGRVVLTPTWEDAAPPYGACFIRCVCQGHAPSAADSGDRAGEAETGPCTNRLNCRLDCPQG